MKHLLRSLLFLCILTGTLSCVTKKRKDDVSKMGMFYHNTTAKFNGYFNANVLLTESIAKLNEQHQDNYNKILAMYPYIAADNPQSVAEQLDEATKKVSIVVSLHRPSHWTDDCYMLIGKSQFLKQNYEDAEETLEYFREKFNPRSLKAKKSNRKKSKKGKKSSSSKKKKSSKASSAKKKKSSAKSRKKARKKYNREVKKKKKGKKSSRSSKNKKGRSEKAEDKPAPPPPKAEEKAEPARLKSAADAEGGFLKHEPCYREGLLWLAKTYIERESYPEAEAIINQLDRDPNTSEEVRAELDGVRAYMLIKQKQYESALPHLEKAAENTKDKEQRARFTYILAQLHQMAGRGETAYQYFEKALKYSTSYEMEFSSRLNLARNGWVTGTATSAETTKKLNKMLKDIKNDEYQDQIYYALSEIALKDNDRPAAKQYLKKSLSSSQGSSPQRTESYLHLAELYFEDQQYVEANAYYDSTLQVMPETDDRFTNVKRFSENLTDIAKNIQIIQEQDSLLRISQLSDKEKQAMAYEMMKQQEEKRRKALLKGSKEDGKSDPKNIRRNNIRRSTSSRRTEPSTFFAYYDKRVKKGKKDFEKRWGKRALEDHWRRSNRRGAGDEAFEEIEDERISLEVTEEDVKKLLKNVPGTPEEIAAANKKIENAYFDLGRLYRDRLENNEKTVETLEELMRRYPDTEHQLEAWYYLYLAHTDLKNRNKAQDYYDKIVSNHPNTTYARVLQDPNFLQASKEEEHRLMEYYDQTYNAYQKGDFAQAKERADKVNDIFGKGKNTMQAKFALLSALCIGNIHGKEAYIAALKNIVAKFPKSDEATRAKEILRLLTGSNVAASGTDEEEGPDQSNFKLQDNKVHYFIVVLEAGSIKLEEAKVAVSNYNRKYHRLDKLRISNIYLGANTNTPILVIRRFKNKNEAMRYFEGIEKNRADFLPDKATYELFAVTQHNYREILKSKSVEGYRSYFEEHYLK